VAEHGKGVIFHFWKAIKENKEPIINGPEVTRDFVYVSDVVDAICLAMKNPTNCRVNISSGKEISLIQLYKLIQLELGSLREPRIINHIPGEILRSCLSNKKAGELLNWYPKIDLSQGIKLCLRSEKNA
jgi:UDP-glucose 4-epimerase